MVKSCYKCGRNNKNDEDATFFTIPAKVEGSKWHTEFIKRLKLGNIEDKEIHICNKHFKPEDIEVGSCMWSLKENALPIEDELEEELIVRPEIIYIDNQCDDDSFSESSETKELAPLEPLVEYIYEDEEEGEASEKPVHIEYEDKCVEFEHDGENVELEPKGERMVPGGVATEGEGSQVVSVVQPKESNLDVEPMMPFFLTSSPVYTIVNENNDVEETIILHMEQLEESKKKPAVTADQLTELENSLCATKRGNIIDEYTCDICDNGYGCLNCLKSHYETFHIAGTPARYKCTHMYHMTKSTVCPVCDRVFPTKEETLDHYITHSVACDLCGSGFDRQAHLTDHYRTIHTKAAYETSYLCELCKAGYQYPGSLAKHYQVFHHMVLCHVCKVRFINVHELQDHESVHREKLDILPFACSKCDKAFPRISDIVVHIRTDHKRGREQKKEEHQVDIVKVPVQKKIKVKK